MLSIIDKFFANLNKKNKTLDKLLTNIKFNDNIITDSITITFIRNNISYTKKNIFFHN